MNSLIEAHHREIDDLCSRFRVKRLEIFGSAATGGFKPGTSDLDFLVEFGPCDPRQRADAYFGLLAALEDLFRCKVDLVEVGAIRNPYFLRSVNESRALLYAA
jgi:hypothetical protein